MKMNRKLVRSAFLLALGEVAYVALVGSVMNNAEHIFGNRPGVIAFVAFLLLFVLSATVSGALILGRPILLYLDGKKREAVELFGVTALWLLIFLIALIIWLVRP